VTPVGAPGSPIGVTLSDGADACEEPIAFIATTVNVYAVPFVSPYTEIVLVNPVPILPSGLDITLYPVIGLPPSLTGGVKLTAAWALPAVAVTPVGASGSAAGVTLAVGADGTESPFAFVATTVNVYSVKFVNPVTVIGLALPVSTSPPGLDVTV
jgi:hypothetical protein